MSDEKARTGSALIHEPLPYIVRLRVAVDEDSAPTVKVFRVTAYSIVEAMAQAMISAEATTVDLGAHVQFRVEDVVPDISRYLLMAHGRP